jgi:sulfofructose kinase
MAKIINRIEKNKHVRCTGQGGHDIMRVLGVGYCTADILLGIDGPLQGNRKIEASYLDIQGGGPVGTAMTALAKWGVRAAFAGSVGGDIIGKFIRGAFRAAGVQEDFLKATEGKFSPLSVAVSDGNGQRTIFYSKGDAPPLLPEDMPGLQVDGFDAVEIDGHQREAQEWLARRCLDAHVPVVLDAGSLRDDILPFLELSHHIVASRDFANAFSPGGDYEKICRSLLRGPAQVAVVTLGEEGSVACDGRRVVNCPALAVDVVDTVGAGDVYHAGYMYGLLRKWDLDRRLRFATAAAGLKCRSAGGQRSIPRLEEIEARLL